MRDLCNICGGETSLINIKGSIHVCSDCISSNSKIKLLIEKINKNLKNLAVSNYNEVLDRDGSLTKNLEDAIARGSRYKRNVIIKKIKKKLKINDSKFNYIFKNMSLTELTDCLFEISSDSSVYVKNDCINSISESNNELTQLQSSLEHLVKV